MWLSVSFLHVKTSTKIYTFNMEKLYTVKDPSVLYQGASLAYYIKFTSKKKETTVVLRDIVSPNVVIGLCL